MKTFKYDNKIFWLITSVTAVRPHKSDRLEIITVNHSGEVQCKSRTVSPSLYKVVKSTFLKEGLQ